MAGDSEIPNPIPKSETVEPERTPAPNSWENISADITGNPLSGGETKNDSSEGEKREFPNRKDGGQQKLDLDFKDPYAKTEESRADSFGNKSGKLDIGKYSDQLGKYLSKLGYGFGNDSEPGKNLGKLNKQEMLDLGKKITDFFADKGFKVMGDIKMRYPGKDWVSVPMNK